MSRHRIVLIAGTDRNDPVQQVLRDYPEGSTDQADREAVADFVPIYPGRVALEWLDTAWHLSGPTWRRYWWFKPEGFPDTRQRDQEAIERRQAEALARRQAQERRKQETARRRKELAALRRADKEKGKSNAR